MLKTFGQCLGLASLLLLENYTELLAGGSHARMHVPFALTGIALANAADIVILAALLFFILAPALRSRAYLYVRLALAIAIPLYFLTRVNTLLPIGLPSGFTPFLAIAWPAALLLIFYKKPDWFRAGMVFASRLGIAFALFAIATLGELLWLTAWNPGPQERTANWTHTPQGPREHPLLVWVVFDELSYDQLFEHRAQTLDLPNFDLLRSVSTLYTDIQPIGRETVKVLPSLVGGKVVEDYRFRWTNKLVLHDQGQPGWQQIGPADSVFADAQRAGWRTAAVGWYNPYCTVYAGAIDDCFWSNQDKIEGPMAQDRTIAGNVATSLTALGERIVSPGRAAGQVCDYDVRQRLKTHMELEQHALQVLHGDQADLVFLHLPIPHSPNIWSRTDKGYTSSCGASYVDNLALADVEVGKILDILKASPRWPKTSLIVEGDHSWRTDLWVGLPAWTDEDEAVSHENFDPRPALLVHRAGQTAPEINSTAWSLLGVHSLVEEILHHGEG